MGYDTLSSQGGAGDIHSLSQVFRLTRAPIFRVFVPCTQLNDAILRTCMAQLYAASLVPQLRAGDLVCNHGICAGHWKQMICRTVGSTVEIAEDG